MSLKRKLQDSSSMWIEAEDISLLVKVFTRPVILEDDFSDGYQGLVRIMKKYYSKVSKRLEVKRTLDDLATRIFTFQNDRASQTDQMRICYGLYERLYKKNVPLDTIWGFHSNILLSKEERDAFVYYWPSNEYRPDPSHPAKIRHNFTEEIKDNFSRYFFQDSSNLISKEEIHDIQKAGSPLFYNSAIAYSKEVAASTGETLVVIPPEAYLAASRHVPFDVILPDKVPKIPSNWDKIIWFINLTGDNPNWINSATCSLLDNDPDGEYHVMIYILDRHCTHAFIYESNRCQQYAINVDRQAKENGSSKMGSGGHRFCDNIAIKITEFLTNDLNLCPPSNAKRPSPEWAPLAQLPISKVGKKKYSYTPIPGPNPKGLVDGECLLFALVVIRRFLLGCIPFVQDFTEQGRNRFITHLKAILINKLHREKVEWANELMTRNVRKMGENILSWRYDCY